MSADRYSSPDKEHRAASTARNSGRKSAATGNSTHTSVFLSTATNSRPAPEAIAPESHSPGAGDGKYAQTIPPGATVTERKFTHRTQNEEQWDQIIPGARKVDDTYTAELLKLHRTEDDGPAPSTGATITGQPDYANTMSAPGSRYDAAGYGQQLSHRERPVVSSAAAANITRAAGTVKGDVSPDNAAGSSANNTSESTGNGSTGHNGYGPYGTAVRPLNVNGGRGSHQSLRKDLIENIKHGTSVFPFAAYIWEPQNYPSRVTLHWHKEMELVRFARGHFKISVDMQETFIENDAFLLLPGNIMHTFTLPAHCEESAVVFDPHMLILQNYDEMQSELFEAMLTSNIPLPPIITPEHPAFARIDRLYRYCVRHGGTSNSSRRLLIKAKLLEILALYHEYGLIARKDVHSDIKRTKQDKLKELLSYIDSHYAGPMTIRDAAQRLGITDQYFCRYFKRVTGMSFTEYLNDLRLRRAAKEISLTVRSISDIAYEHGFENAGYFFKSFKKKYGITPLNYRRQYQEPGSDTPPDQASDLAILTPGNAAAARAAAFQDATAPDAADGFPAASGNAAAPAPASADRSTAASNHGNTNSDSSETWTDHNPENAVFENEHDEYIPAAFPLTPEARIICFTRNRTAASTDTSICTSSTSRTKTAPAASAPDASAAAATTQDEASQEQNEASAPDDAAVIAAEALSQFQQDQEQNLKPKPLPSTMPPFYIYPQGGKVTAEQIEEFYSGKMGELSLAQDPTKTPDDSDWLRPQHQRPSPTPVSIVPVHRYEEEQLKAAAQAQAEFRQATHFGTDRDSTKAPAALAALSHLSPSQIKALNEAHAASVQPADTTSDATANTAAAAAARDKTAVYAHEQEQSGKPAPVNSMNHEAVTGHAPASAAAVSAEAAAHHGTLRLDPDVTPYQLDESYEAQYGSPQPEPYLLNPREQDNSSRAPLYSDQLPQLNAWHFTQDTPDRTLYHYSDAATSPEWMFINNHNKELSADIPGDDSTRENQVAPQPPVSTISPVSPATVPFPDQAIEPNATAAAAQNLQAAPTLLTPSGPLSPRAVNSSTSIHTAHTNTSDSATMLLKPGADIAESEALPPQSKQSLSAGADGERQYYETISEISGLSTAADNEEYEDSTDDADSEDYEEDELDDSWWDEEEDEHRISRYHYTDTMRNNSPGRLMQLILNSSRIRRNIRYKNQSTVSEQDTTITDNSAQAEYILQPKNKPKSPEKPGVRAKGTKGSKRRSITTDDHTAAPEEAAKQLQVRTADTVLPRPEHETAFQQKEITATGPYAQATFTLDPSRGTVPAPDTAAKAQDTAAPYPADTAAPSPTGSTDKPKRRRGRTAIKIASPAGRWAATNACFSDGGMDDNGIPIREALSPDPKNQTFSIEALNRISHLAADEEGLQNGSAIDDEDDESSAPEHEPHHLLQKHRTRHSR